MDPIERGQKAAEILNNPIFNEAFDELEGVYIDIIKSLPVSDVKTLSHYKQALVSVSFIKGHFETALTQGELSSREADLEQKSKVTQLFRKF